MKNSKNKNYDWAEAALSVIECPSTDLRKLVAAAKLDAENGDLSDADFSDLDLRGQDLSGWDLSHASFEGARIAGANLTNTLVNVDSLIGAEDWNQADLDDDTLLNAVYSRLRKIKIEDLELSIRPGHSLLSAGYLTVGDLLKSNVAELLRIRNFGRKSFNELREALAFYNVKWVENVSDLNFTDGEPDYPLGSAAEASDDWEMTEPSSKKETVHGQWIFSPPDLRNKGVMEELLRRFTSASEYVQLQFK